MRLHYGMSLTACHECDALQRVPDAPGGAVVCHRCGAKLHRLGAYDVSLALALAVKLTPFPPLERREEQAEVRDQRSEVRRDP